MTAENGLDERTESIVEPPQPPKNPPKATIARRAQSYSDFYHIARAQLKKDKAAAKLQERKHTRRGSQISSEVERLDSDDWYEDIADQLLETSHDKYT